MTLPANGPISLAAIAAEFGLPATTTFPTGFYGKGGAPAAGALSFGDFYGRTNGGQFTPDGGNVSGDGDGFAQATLSCSAAATWTFTGGGTGGTVSRASGTSGTDITFSVSAAPGPKGNTGTRSVTWNVTGVSGGFTRNFQVTVTAYGQTNELLQ